MLRSFQEISAQNLQVMTGILVTFAAIITFSVVYNSARIALSERRRQQALTVARREVERIEAEIAAARACKRSRAIRTTSSMPTRRKFAALRQS